MMMWEESNRDKQRPTFPLKEDLRIQTSNIVKAHEIIRKGLQQYLKLREADLGAYLSYIIQNNPTFVDEYGQEIPSYYKIFRFIWEQYNETVCQNYAVKQFDKDKLDLCGVARFLSHQPVVEDHQNIMKRMGHVLNYTCHPCTPYKRKEYGEIIVPNTDDISPDGFSPRYSFILCKEYGVDEKGQLILLSTPTTSTTPVPGKKSKFY